jgi:outer membrane cobalamin receptor
MLTSTLLFNDMNRILVRRKLQRTLTTLCLPLLMHLSLSAQPRGMERDGSVSGRVVDAATGIAIEYANIVVYAKEDGAMVTGSVTNPDGRFHLTGLPAGHYSIEARFMGYHSRVLTGIILTQDSMALALRDIRLESTALPMNSIDVVGERQAMVYRIDKKVINVARQHTTASGTAVDVLENVPSVSVDLEGNVNLRGSRSFTLLIDGRPTVLDANEALQQIPAGTIDNIEIITNPSAKFDPSGMSGIINVIMSKNRPGGVSGIVNANTGFAERYSGDVLSGYRTENAYVYVGADYSRNVYPGTRRTETQTTHNGITQTTRSRGDSRRDYNPFGIRGAVELNLTSDDFLTFGGRFGGRSMEGSNTLLFDVRSADTAMPSFSSSDLWKRSGPHYALNLDYKHSFDNDRHFVSTLAQWSRRGGEELSTNELRDERGVILSGQRSTESGPTVQTSLKMDYTRPLGENDRIEAGYDAKLETSRESNTLHEYNGATGLFDFQPSFSHEVEYIRDVHGMYGLFVGEIRQLGYQLGVRAEYTHRIITMVGESLSFDLRRWDVFPTLHASYGMSDSRQIIASYARRIERPRGWWLEPFLTWSDAYNVRRGNPDLKPEYIDSYEIGHQSSIGDHPLTVEIYYRATHNKVERVRSVFADNVILHSMENVGKDHSLGAEFMTSFAVGGWWTVNSLWNVYAYRIDGVLYNAPFSRTSLNWSTRLNNELKLFPGNRLQVNARYTSPTASSQGRTEGYFSADLAVRQEIFDRKVSVTLQVKDVFRSIRDEYTSEGAGLYYYQYSLRNAPIVMLNVSFNFNNFKQEIPREGERGDFEGGEGF